ncbi:MAG: MBOAT family O-acyltransferase [Acidimicrobiia bacterium]
MHRLPWKIAILIASYIFLGFNQPSVSLIFTSIPLPCLVLATSIVFNYLIVNWLTSQKTVKAKKIVLSIAIAGNVGALGYFKYRNFVIEQAHNIFKDTIGLPRLSSLIIPIAISFFTFQAISYVVDVYRGTIEKVGFLDLAVYLSFFPHLVAGPIVRASEFIPQMRNPHNPRAVETTKAATLIAKGLFKKMIIADLLYVQIVRPAFGAPSKLGGIDAIVAVYAYAAQLYCDFSGYTDIAIGVALLLGFRFPENFNRPYSATSLRNFWQRWHMTLSRWLKDYVYIPLGGNKKSIFGKRFIAFNLIATMTIGGLWHGANITFLVWGFYMGVMLTIERWLRAFTQKHEIVIPKIVKQIATFHVVTFGWIIFASESMSNARIMISKMISGFSEPVTLTTFAIVILILCGILIQSIPQRITGNFSSRISAQPIYLQALVFGVALMLLSALSGTVSAFIYGFF